MLCKKSSLCNYGYGLKIAAVENTLVHSYNNNPKYASVHLVAFTDHV
jgi:hypothetical protein